MGGKWSRFFAQRMADLTNVVALGFLVWQFLDVYTDLDPRELAGNARTWAAGKWSERAEWRRTFAAIRELPETEEKE